MAADTWENLEVADSGFYKYNISSHCAAIIPIEIMKNYVFMFPWMRKQEKVVSNDENNTRLHRAQVSCI